MEFEELNPFRHYSDKILANRISFCKYYDEELLIDDELSENEFDKFNYMDDDDDDNEINNEKSSFQHYICNNEHNKNDEFINVNNFEIFCYFKINKENEFIYSIHSDSLNLKTQCVYDLIKNIIKKINQSNIIIEYNSLKYNLSLKDSDDENDIDFYINNYELRHCKKRKNVPDFDLPCYCSNSILNNMINEKISFVTKNPLNIILIENYDNYNENFCNNKIKYINNDKKIENGFNLKKVKSTNKCNIF